MQEVNPESKMWASPIPISRAKARPLGPGTSFMPNSQSAIRNPQFVIFFLSVWVALTTVHCPWVRRFPEGPAVFGWQVQARWRWRESDHPPVRLRWEACWSGPVGSALWTDDFGQSRLALVMDPSGVDLLAPDRRRWWTWTNAPDGWQAVLGLPLTGEAFWAWLQGRWPDAAQLRAGGAVWEDRPDPEVPGHLLRIGQWGEWHFELGIRVSDDRVLGGTWTHPTGLRFRWASTYADDGSFPVAIAGVWENGSRRVQMAWHRLEWRRGPCRGVRRPEDVARWTRVDVESMEAPAVPLIFTVWEE